MREKNLSRFLLLELAALTVIHFDGMLCPELVGLIACQAALGYFLIACLRRSEEARRERTGYLCCFFALFAASVFPGKDYFGSPMMYVMILVFLLLAVAVVRGKTAWFQPLCLLGAVLLAYLPKAGSGKLRSYCGIRPVTGWRVADLLVFLLLMLPYLLLAVRFFLELMRGGNKRCLSWLLGSLVLLPGFFTNRGYGNLMYAFFFYFSGVFLACYAAEDSRVTAAAEICQERIRRLGAAKLLLLIYPVLLQPLAEFPVSRLSGQILRFFS